MSTETKPNTRFKHRTAALMTVFGLVPAAALACPDLVSGPQNAQLLTQYLEGAAYVVVLMVPVVALFAYWGIRYFRQSNTNRQDERDLLNGQAWARWQYGPGEWQRSCLSPFSRRDPQVPTPWVLIGPYGVYNQLNGFQSTRNVSSAQFQTINGVSDPYFCDDLTRLEFVLRDSMNALYARSRFGAIKKVVVAVPHGKEAEAVALMNRFITERLQGRNG